MSDKEKEKFELMLDTFAHYLRSPLTSIKGAASVLKQTEVELEEDSKRELITIISDESERLNKIIDKLVWMVRLEAGKIQANSKQTNTLVLIESIIEKLKGILGKNKIEIQIPKNAALVAIDPELIGQCLFYLLENAIKFSHPGENILVKVTLEQDKVSFSIIDKGSGITESKQKEIFSKFYRPPQQVNSLPSVGMSLAICQGIVTSYNGTLELTSNDGQGTIVTIKVPISKETP